MYFAQQEHLVTYGIPLMEDTFVSRKHRPVATLTYKVLHLAEGMKAVSDRWIEKCKDVKSFELADLSHDRAWLKAKRRSEKTGEDTKIPLVDIAAAAGASKEMIIVIRARQLNQKILQWT